MKIEKKTRYTISLSIRNKKKFIKFRKYSYLNTAHKYSFIYTKSEKLILNHHRYLFAKLNLTVIIVKLKKILSTIL